VEVVTATTHNPDGTYRVEGYRYNCGVLCSVSGKLNLLVEDVVGEFSVLNLGENIKICHNQVAKQTSKFDYSSMRVVRLKTCHNGKFILVCGSRL